MDLHQFYKDHYFYEAEKAHKLTGSLTLPIGILTIIGGALTATIEPIGAHVGFMEVTRLLFQAIAWISILAAGYFVVRSRFRYVYDYIPTPQQVSDYRDYLISSSDSTGAVASKVDDKLERWINSSYAQCAHTNTLNNDKKSTYLHSANVFIIFALIFTILSAGPYLRGLYLGPTDALVETAEPEIMIVINPRNRP